MSGRAVSFAATGGSMLPFIKPGATVTLRARAAYRRGDIVLAMIRPQGRVVLHYVADCHGDCFTLMGAANLVLTERCMAGDVIGAVEAPRISRRLVALWHVLLPLRRYLLWIYRKF